LKRKVYSVAFLTVAVVGLICSALSGSVLDKGPDNQTHSIVRAQVSNPLLLTALFDNSTYAIGQIVTVNGTLTYNGGSVANVAVAVSVFDPLGTVVFVKSATTGKDGNYSLQFRPPIPPTWLPGLYNCSASAAVGENKVASNISSCIFFTALDFNHDGLVDFNDVTYFVDSYLSYYQSGIANPACDLNHDGKIDFQDVTMFVNGYNAYLSSLTMWQRLS